MSDKRHVLAMIRKHLYERDVEMRRLLAMLESEDEPANDAVRERKNRKDEIRAKVVRKIWG